MRSAIEERITKETDIKLSLALDGSGKSEINSGCGFLDHMLTLFASHSRFDLKLDCLGDTEVDYHHSVEDIAICLGRAFSVAIGDKKGIKRYGSMMLPMDEALLLVSLDISGRGLLVYDVTFEREKVGDFDTELAEEFFRAFAHNAGITLHIKMLDGKNTHHIIEGCFKAFARALREAVSVDLSLNGEIPSSKGVL